MFLRMPRPLLGLVSLVAVMAALLSGCSGDDQPTAAIDPTADPNTAYGLDLPQGIELTALGTNLELGDAAQVAWQADKSTVGVIAVKVTKLRKGTLKDFAGFTLDDQTMKSTPYYVDATVKNIGKSDLSGQLTPLYLVDGDDVLVRASTFQSTFSPCTAKPLPEKFKPGRTTRVCLVYLAGDYGTLQAISFRPTQKYAPIQWTGELTKSTKDKPRKKKG